MRRLEAILLCRYMLCYLYGEGLKRFWLCRTLRSSSPSKKTFAAVRAGLCSVAGTLALCFTVSAIFDLLTKLDRWAVPTLTRYGNLIALQRMLPGVFGSGHNSTPSLSTSFLKGRTENFSDSHSSLLLTTALRIESVSSSASYSLSLIWRTRSLVA